MPKPQESLASILLATIIIVGVFAIIGSLLSNHHCQCWSIILISCPLLSISIHCPRAIIYHDSLATISGPLQVSHPNKKATRLRCHVAGALTRLENDPAVEVVVDAFVTMHTHTHAHMITYVYIVHI